MTPAIVLDKVLPRWRATLPTRYSSDLVDRFISRNRSALETVVDRTMILRSERQREAVIPEEIVPETFGLIHEYYTPTVIADSMAALEPSAGIRRLIRAFSPHSCLHAGPRVRDDGRAYRGKFGLVVCNPPHGERGTLASIMRRTLDLPDDAGPRAASASLEAPRSDKSSTELDEELLTSFCSELDVVLDAVAPQPTRPV
jgi:hypothetical protein